MPVFKKKGKCFVSVPRETKKDDFEMILEDQDTPLSRIENRTIMNIIEQNFIVIKKHISIAVQSIFDSITMMPIGLRVLCKIIHMSAKKRV